MRLGLKKYQYYQEDSFCEFISKNKIYSITVIKTNDINGEKIETFVVLYVLPEE